MAYQNAFIEYHSMEMHARVMPDDKSSYYIYNISETWSKKKQSWSDGEVIFRIEITIGNTFHDLEAS